MDRNLKYEYASTRRVVFGKHGMVATTQPLAAQTGLDILRKGGNAVDAAIATAAMLSVVEPTSNGIGGDAFALVWIKDRLYGLNGSGPAPAEMNAARIQEAGLDSIPRFGWLPVTVPGEPAAWQALNKRFGRLPLCEVLEPAAKYAEEGFPVSPVISMNWDIFAKQCLPALEGEMYQPLKDTFFPNGRAPRAGELMKMPDHARTLREIGQTEAESFYRGALADRIDAFSRKTGGFLRKKDLADYHAEWVEPISVGYHGYRVWEIPPNGHGLSVLMTLNILDGFTLTSRHDAESIHKMIESMKLGYEDGQKYISDPRTMQYTVEELLNPAYAASRRTLIGEQAILPAPGVPPKGGTVYLCTADEEGNMVSYIQSNYHDFGSGLVVPGTGICLHDRGQNFSLDPSSGNYIMPGKKPYHTIIPGFLTQADGKTPIGPFGVMGGFMQPQGHVQVVANLVDFGLNPQQCLDAPRWRWLGGKRVEVEQSFPPALIAELSARGHEISVTHEFTDFGRGEIICRDDSGVLCGGTEPRADGVVAAW